MREVEFVRELRYSNCFGDIETSDRFAILVETFVTDTRRHCNRMTAGERSYKISNMQSFSKSALRVLMLAIGGYRNSATRERWQTSRTYQPSDGVILIL